MEDEEPEDEGEEENRADEGQAPVNSTGEVAPARDIIADARTRASLTIVIQPGTDYLRIGRATDPVPTVIPHCIARLWKKSGPEMIKLSLDRNKLASENDLRERDKEVQEVERGLKRWSAPTRKAGGGSGDATEEEVSDYTSDPMDTTENNLCSDGAPFYVGEDALKVSGKPNADGSMYVLRRPMYRYFILHNTCILISE